MSATLENYPTTEAEWQTAVNLAAAQNAHRAAIAAGLMRGTADGDVRDCDHILSEGKKLQIQPETLFVRRYILDRM